MMDRSEWDRIAGLFDRLLASNDPETTAASESDSEIRAAALNLWQHHIRANEENYLDTPIEFEITPLFQAGQILLKRFRIEKMLGSGGMGEVIPRLGPASGRSSRYQDHRQTTHSRTSHPQTLRPPKCRAHAV